MITLAITSPNHRILHRPSFDDASSISRRAISQNIPIRDYAQEVLRFYGYDQALSVGLKWALIPLCLGNAFPGFFRTDIHCCFDENSLLANPIVPSPLIQRQTPFSLFMQLVYDSVD
jgi:hypothetical protein